MPPKRSRPNFPSSSSETDEGAVVPRQPDPSDSSGSKTKEARKLITGAPTRNKIIWIYFDKDPDFVKSKPNEFAKVRFAKCHANT
jgi:hypothetical protein